MHHILTAEAVLPIEIKGHGHPVSLDELLDMLSFYRDDKAGTVSILHPSGSYIRWSDDGTIEVEASRNLRIGAKRYTLLSDPTTEAEADAEVLALIAKGDTKTFEAILAGKLPHLLERAKAAAAHGVE